MTGQSRPAMQRAASLMPLAMLLQGRGVALDRVLQGTGVSADDLAPNRFIPFAAFLSVLDRAAEATGLEDFGLHLGRDQGLAALGPLGQLMRQAETLGDALSDFTGFQIGNATGGSVYLRRFGDDVLLGYGLYDAPRAVPAHIYDLTLAIGCCILRELSGGAVKPLEILALRPAPRQAAGFLRLADCPVRFDQAENGLVLSRASLEFRLAQADKAAHTAGVAALTATLAQRPISLSGRVRHALRPMLLQGRATMPDMARGLAMHPRSLRRRLADEGGHFEALVAATRCQMACELLALTRLTAAEIGQSLGYSTPSGFHHAFRRWTGQTPADWRVYPSRRRPS